MPDKSDKIDVKEKIITESAKLFLTNGFHGTSVKRITEAVGIGRGTLYWYFKSKDEILESIIYKFNTVFLDGLIDTVSKCEGNFIAKYRAFHKFATEFARDNRELGLAFNAILNEIVGTNTKAEEVVKIVYERYRSFIENMLENGKRDGSVRKDIDSTIFAHVIIASHSGMLMQWFVSGETLDIRIFVKAFRDMILRGVTES
jgi:AcrR family transcriptional regulator